MSLTRALVPFADFDAHVASQRAEIDAAMKRVLDSGWFILGPEVAAFENELCAAVEAPAAVAVGSGTDAIELALRAAGIGAGAEVITSPLTAAFTAMAILRAGATPVFADVDEATLNLDAAAVEARLSPRTRAIVPVHLYGHPADLDPLMALARRRDLVVVEDACQAHGARYKGRTVGTIGDAGALSFYPTKNLGAFGDGGAVLTSDLEAAARLRRLRNGGQSDRYHHEIAGANSRLDEIQAAVLRGKLRHLRDWTERRRALASLYHAELRGAPITLPVEQPYAWAVYHLFVIRHSHRDALVEALAADGIETLTHYPVPLHLQRAFLSLGGRPGDHPVAEKACSEILSLPLYPELREEQVRHVAARVRDLAAQL